MIKAITPRMTANVSIGLSFSEDEPYVDDQVLYREILGCVQRNF